MSMEENQVSAGRPKAPTGLEGLLLKGLMKIGDSHKAQITLTLAIAFSVTLNIVMAAIARPSPAFLAIAGVGGLLAGAVPLWLGRSILLWRIRQYSRGIADGLARLADRIAGSAYGDLRESWCAHLAASSDAEIVRDACGIVVAAVKVRLEDAAERCWRPADAVLKSRLLSNLAVAVPTVSAAWVLFRHGGGVDALGHSSRTIRALRP